MGASTTPACKGHGRFCIAAVAATCLPLLPANAPRPFNAWSMSPSASSVCGSAAATASAECRITATNRSVRAWCPVSAGGSGNS